MPASRLAALAATMVSLQASALPVSFTKIADASSLPGWNELATIPEPGTAMLLAAGLVALGARARRIR